MTELPNNVPSVELIAHPEVRWQVWTWVDGGGVQRTERTLQQKHFPKGGGHAVWLDVPEVPR